MDRKQENLNIIKDSGFNYESINDGDTLKFEACGDTILFFTKTGRWKVLPSKKPYFSGAKQFINWLQLHIERAKEK